MSLLYKEFIDLSYEHCHIHDYQDKNKVLDHNKAQKKLLKLQKEILSNEPNTMLLLLQHDDERVRLNAAAGCVSANVFVGEAQNTLRLLVKQALDPTIRLSSRMLLFTTDKKDRATRNS